jgi:hypothetical protein
MNGSARQAAVDQARLLAVYLHDTPGPALDLDFIRRHLDALKEFAQAAKVESASTSCEEGRSTPFCPTVIPRPI